MFWSLVSIRFSPVPPSGKVSVAIALTSTLSTRVNGAGSVRRMPESSVPA